MKWKIEAVAQQRLVESLFAFHHKNILGTENLGRKSN